MPESDNKIFGELLSEGINSIRAHRKRLVSAIEYDIGEMLGYRGGSMVQHYRKGNVPDDPEQVIKIASYCITEGELGFQWARRFLHYGRVPNSDKYLAELFSPEINKSPSPAPDQNRTTQETYESIHKSDKNSTYISWFSRRPIWLVISAVLIVILILVLFIIRPPFIQTIAGQKIPNTGSATEPSFPPPPTAIPFEITNVSFDPLPPAKTDNVKIFACVQGNGGVGNTLRVSVNPAPDGSERGTWEIIKELGVSCFSQGNAPVWQTKGWKPGTYLIKIEAKASTDPNWNHPAVERVTYTLK